MLLRLKPRRKQLLLLLILVERLLGAAVAVVDVVANIDSGVLVRRAVRVVVSVVTLAVGVRVVELVVAGVELVNAVVVWRDRLQWGDAVSDESGAVMLHYVHLSVRGPPLLLLGVGLWARGAEAAPHFTSATSVLHGCSLSPPPQEPPPFDDADGVPSHGDRGGVAVACRPSSYRHGRRDAAAACRSSRHSHDTQNAAFAGAGAGVAAAGAVEVNGA